MALHCTSPRFARPHSVITEPSSNTGALEVVVTRNRLPPELKHLSRVCQGMGLGDPPT